MESDEINKIGYYAVIPSTVLYDNELKPNEKLLYAVISTLANKEGFCYASNKYLGEKLEAESNTVSKWITHLRKKGYLIVQLIRNEQKEVISRKIYPNDTPYRINIQYPYSTKIQEGIGQKSKENNISINNINTYTVAKQNYADNVSLYEHEYNQLINEYGEEKTKKCIDELSLYKKSKGVEYKSDFATIKRWVIISVDEKEARINKSKSNNYTKDSKKNSFMEYEQREYPPEFFDGLYENNNITSEDEDELEM